MSDTMTLATPMPDAALTEAVRRDFAVIVPAYNEAENVPELIAELRATFERHGLAGEVILVDDGSTDGTAAAAEAEAARWERLRVLRHRRNFGKTEALVTAAEATRAQWLVLFDADLQHATEEIPRFLDKLGEGWDIVTGRKVGFYEKRLVSGIYNRLSRRIFDVPVSDTNSMKAFRRAILDEVHLRHDWHRFFVVLAYARGYTLTEIDITLLARRRGVAKYSGKSRIVVGLLDLLSVWFFLFFARKPLLLFGVSGLVMAALGVLVGLATIVLRIAHWVSPIGYRPFLYLVILLEVVGFLLFGFGFLAELIAQQQAELDALQRRGRLRRPRE
ncbi:MAG TPA: glycosyltransferase family 2 protein [Longimicrobiales bacterium]|nr:glycosyltransferase family 2 protein [Longimicrobiales bacterium]